MFKRILAVSVLILAATVANAATLSSSTCPGTGCVDFNVSGSGSIAIQITGTWTGTLTFRSTVDNSTFTDFRMVASSDTSSAGVTSTTSNGSFQGTVAGLSQVRVIFTAGPTGSAVVTARVVNAAAKFNGPSGGSIVAACGASDSQILYVNGTTCAGDSGLTWNDTTPRLSITSSGAQDLAVSVIATDTSAAGFPIGIQVQTVTSGTQNLDGQTGILVLPQHTSTGTITDVTGIQINNPIKGGGAGALTNAYGLLVSSITSASNNFAISTGTGTVHFGDDSNLTSGKFWTANYITQGSGLAVANVGANSCGTTAATIDGNSNSFEITVGAGAGTQCRVTFPTAAPNRWNCAVTDSTTTIATRATVVDTTHTDFFGAFVAGDVVTAICLPR